MRLIDADALLQKGVWTVTSGDIKNAPTIDPVKHGKWELVGSTTMCDPFGELAWGKMYKCSECGFARNVIKYSEHYKFCPNCGARMDGE